MRIFLAPMEGVVDHHLRAIYAQLGVDACVTEFVRVSQTLLPEKVFKRLCPELLDPISVPVRVQLLGSEPKLLALNARKAAKMGAPAIDLNFGCPAKTVNKNRGGACLLDEPELLHDIVKTVRTFVPASTPVTAKIRLGFNDRTRYLENAAAIESAGADELIVHARSKADGYRPPAYWSYIGEIRERANIPIVANGEIWSLNDFIRCREESGCDDFMLGRGLLSRPDLALAIKAHVSGLEYAALNWDQLLPTLKYFHEATHGFYPKKYCGNRLKQWLMYLKRTYSEADSLFEQIKPLRDHERIMAALSATDNSATNANFDSAQSLAAL